MKGVSRRKFLLSTAGIALATSAKAKSAALIGGSDYDFVVAGAGHNSLITAAYLAKAGFRILVLEGRPTIGGGCKTAESCLPGFQDDMCSTVHGLLMSNPLIKNNELDLFDYGLEYIIPDPIMHIPFADGTSITLWKDMERTYAEYAKFSKKDAETFRRMIGELKAYRKGVASGRVENPGLWRRRFAMSGYDLITELFENDHVRSLHLALGAITSVPASDPGSGKQAYNAIAHQIGGRPIPKGGSGMLTTALGRFIEDHGGVIETNKPVEALMIESGRCVGVECADGSQYRAKQAVVSTIHIKQLVNMAPDRLWGSDFLENLELFQPEHAMFSLHFATSSPLEYPLMEGGFVSPAESVILPYPERILRRDFDEARGVVNLKDMPLQIFCPSVADPSRAPEGYHTLKIIGNLPYQLKEGPEHWDKIKKQVSDDIVNYVRGFAPSLTPDKILAEFLMSPLDIERMNPAMWKGSVHSGGYGPAQMGDMRPVPGWADYKMPIPGLYQTGACTAPGGSITGKPGRNAAKVILQDMGTSLEAVVKGTGV